MSIPPYTPPFHSSRQDQANYAHGTPQFSSVTIGDTEEGVTGTRLLTFQRTDDVGEQRRWHLGLNLPDSISLVSAYPSVLPLFDVSRSLVSAVVPLEVSDSTDATSDGVGAIRTPGGLWVAKSIRAGGAVRASEFTLASGGALARDLTGSIATSSGDSASIVALSTEPGYTYGVSVLATWSRDGGATGFHSLTYKCKNVGGVITNSLPALSAGAIDAGLEGTEIQIGVIGTTSAVLARGIALVSIKWHARMTVVSGPL